MIGCPRYHIAKLFLHSLQDKRFFCVVTVNSIGTEHRYWFASCSICRKFARYIGPKYQCSGLSCPSVDADLTYCVSIWASDGTAEAEFVFFDKVAAAAIKKPLAVLLRQRYPGHATLEDIAQVARFDTTIPPEINRLVQQKYKLMVSISKKSLSANSEKLSSQINRVEETYKPALPALAFGAASGSAGQSSSSQVPDLRHGSLPAPALPAICLPSGFSPQTLLSSANKFAPATPGTSSTAHMRGPRRSLFSTPAKGKNNRQEEEPALTSEVIDTSLEADANSSITVAEGVENPILPPAVDQPDAGLFVPVAEEKEEPTLPPKTKRSAGPAKLAGTGKKAKQQWSALCRQRLYIGPFLVRYYSAQGIHGDGGLRLASSVAVCFSGCLSLWVQRLSPTGLLLRCPLFFSGVSCLDHRSNTAGLCFLLDCHFLSSV